MARFKTGKTLLAIAVSIVGIVGILIAISDPRPEIDVHVPMPDLPDDLDGYLARAESRFSDIRPNTEKTIVWANPERKQKTEVALVYLHGFSASRQEVNPLCQIVANALHANSFYTRLRGHGRTGEAMAEATVTGWLQDAVEALAIGQRLGRRVVVIGTSTGATLATWLATRAEARDVIAFVLISPNFYPRDTRANILLWPWGDALARLVLGSHREWEPANDLQRSYWTNRYPTSALVTMMSLVELVQQQDLSRLHQPVLILYSDRDQVVNADVTQKRYEEFGSATKRLVLVNDTQDPSYHVIAGDIMSPNTTAKLAAIVQEFLQTL